MLISLDDSADDMDEITERDSIEDMARAPPYLVQNTTALYPNDQYPNVQ